MAHPSPPRTGRPRDSDVDTAIVRATLDLVAETGVRCLTMAAIAARAGVGRPSLYRRHRSVDDVLVACVDTLNADVPLPDTGSVREDLLIVAGSAAQLLSRPRAHRLVVELLAAKAADPRLREVMSRHWEARRVESRPVVRRAVDRGQLPAGADPDLLLDMLIGAVYLRRVHRDRPMTDDDVERLVDAVLGAAAAGAGPAAG